LPIEEAKMKLMISEILEQVSNAKSETDKINILRKNYSPALEDVLYWAYSPNIIFYTKSVPPYTPDQSPEGLSLTSLYNEHKRFYMFLKNSKIDSSRKNILLIQMLESLGVKEAKILEQIINKNIVVISKELAERAYPGLFNKPLRIPMEA
jgi:hypothetical protein